MTRAEITSAEDAKALGIAPEKYRGTVQHRRRWVKLIAAHYGTTTKGAAEVYADAMEQQGTRFRFGRFAEAVHASAGKIDGLNTLTDPSGKRVFS